MADFSIFGELGLNIKDWESKISQAMSDTKKLAADVSNNLKNTTGKLSSGLKGWGINLDQFYDKGSSIFKDFGIDIDKFASKFGVKGKVVAAIAAATIALEKLGQQMDEAKAEIVKGTGASGKALESLEASMRKAMQNGVGAPVQEVAGIVADLNTRFGLVGDELTDLTDTFDMFSGVTGVDARQAIDSVADVMAKWNITTESTDVLLDQLVKASQDSGASVESLMSALEQGQAVFSQFGMNVTEATAFLANLKKQGIDSSTALQALKMGMAKFASEGKNAKEAFAEIGEKIKNASSQTEAMQLAMETFGSKAGADMVKVFQSGAASVEEYAAALEDAGGALANTDENSRTVKDALDDLKGTLMGTFGQFGQAVSGVFKDLIDSVRDVISVLSPTIDAIGGFLRKILTAVSGFVKDVVFYITDLVKRMSGSGNVFRSILNMIGNNFARAFSAVTWVIDKAYRGIAIAIDGIKLAFLYLEKGIAPILNSILEKITKGVNGIINVINTAVDKINSVAETLGVEFLKINRIRGINPNTFRIDEKGIEQNIANVKADIQDLLNHAEKKGIEYKDTTTEVVATGITELGKVQEAQFANIGEWDDKLLALQIDELEQEKQTALQKLEIENATQEQIYTVEKNYNDKILDLKKKQLERERKEELKKVANTKNAKEAEIKINQFYDKKLEKLEKEQYKKTEKTTKKTQKAAEKTQTALGELLGSIQESIGNVASTALTTMGEALVEGGSAWDSFKSVALNAIADMLQGISKYLVSLAAMYAAQENYAMAAVSLAGAGAALVASGAVSALADKTEDISENLASGALSLEDFKSSIKDILSSISDTKSLFDAYSQLETTFTNVTAELSSAYDNIGAKQEALAQAEKEYAKALKKDAEYQSNREHGSGDSPALKYAKKQYSNAKEALVNAEKYYAQVQEKYRLAYEAMINTIADYKQSFIDTRSENEETIQNYIDLYNAVENYNQALNDTTMTELERTFALAKYAAYIGLIEEQIMSTLSQTRLEIYQELATLGVSVGETLVSGIVEGSSKTDFLSEMKSMIKENVVKLAVYTESFNKKLASVGSKLATAISGGGSLTAIRDELEDIWDSASASATKALGVVEEAFGDIIDTSTDALSSLAEAVESFTETIADLGADIADNLIDGISNGLSQSDFLSNMKDWLRKLLVQTVVYTESMKGEIEAIGKTISEGLANGFSGDSLQAIRRDLSYIFYSANKSMTSIDTLLDSVFDEGYANGTSNATKGLHLVGEQGPELVRFRGGEQVYTAKETSDIIGGGSTFNVTFNNLQDTSAFEMMNQMQNWQKQLAFNAVI